MFILSQLVRNETEENKNEERQSGVGRESGLNSSAATVTLLGLDLMLFRVCELVLR